MMRAAVGDTNPAAGVMVAGPATAPVRSPRKWGLLLRSQSTVSQVTAAKEAATSVLRKATAVTESTRNSLPALEPYHPNQRRPVPRATRGMLGGPAAHTRGLPTYTSEASA